MPTLPIDQWQTALDRMETALAAATKALDRSSEQWESRLHAAEALTTSVEAELAERAAAVGRWRALFAQWEQFLKR